MVIGGVLASMQYIWWLYTCLAPALPAHGPKISLMADAITAASKVKQTLETSYTPREVSYNQTIAGNKTLQLYYKLN